MTVQAKEEHPSNLPPRVRDRIRIWGAVLWPSFLVAGIATMIFFANVDPEELQASTFPTWEISRKAGYTIGFFMFWGVTALSSFLTTFLLTPASGGPANTASSHDR